MKRNSHNDGLTANDYRDLFASSKESLRWLCYTLTGDHQLSDKVVDAVLQQSLKGAGPVFREWMLSWARRLIIRFSIMTVHPIAPEGALPGCSCGTFERMAVDPFDRNAILKLPAQELQRRLLCLDVLSRFVFVLRALEGYSRRDSALLLNVDDRTCECLYLQAFGALAAEQVQIEGSWNAPLPQEASYAFTQAGD